MRLLQDNSMIADGLARALQQSGYAVDAAGDTQAGRISLANEKYDLVILVDLGLPDGSGLNIPRELRARRDPIPVLIVTARDT